MAGLPGTIVLTLAALVAVLSLDAGAATVRVAVIETLSGPFAPVGKNYLHSYQLFAAMTKQQDWAGGNTIEVVAFDNQGSPQEALAQFRAATEQGFRFIAQGASSDVALALSEAITVYNERNPGREVVYLNHAATDPDLTNDKCSFWHFRFDASSDMKMEALSTFMARDRNIRNIYIIGQDYSYGRKVRQAARAMVTRKRRDIRIVGDELHPLAQVTDFAPYVERIRASGADTVVTGNWGADLALLVKAAKEAELHVNFYTFYAGTTGVPSAIGVAGVNRVKYIGSWNVNNETYAGRDIVEAFRKKYRDDFHEVAPYTAMRMLAAAMRETRSVDPVRIAFALEGMKFRSLNGDVEMRKSDHQLQQPLYISTWVYTNLTDVRIEQENTGLGWRTEQKVGPEASVLPTTCVMKRPANNGWGPAGPH